MNSRPALFAIGDKTEFQSKTYEYHRPIQRPPAIISAHSKFPTTRIKNRISFGESTLDISSEKSGRTSMRYAVCHFFHLWKEFYRKMWDILESAIRHTYGMTGWLTDGFNFVCFLFSNIIFLSKKDYNTKYKWNVTKSQTNILLSSAH